MKKMVWIVIVCFVVALAACGEEESASSASVALPEFTIPLTPASSTSEDAVASSEPVVSSVPASSVAPSSVSVAPEPNPAPKFIENTPAPGVDLTTETVNVLYKTDVTSTVNAILTTDPTSINTTAFYDYFNRGQALSGAVSKARVYAVDSSGKTLSFDLPDLTKTYYVLSNAAEDATGTWQSTISIVKVYEPNSVQITSATRQADANGMVNISVQTSLPCVLHGVVYTADNMPTAQQVKDGGAGFSGTVISKATVSTSTGGVPYAGTLQFSNIQAGGTYYVYIAAEIGNGLSEVYKLDITV